MAVPKENPCFVMDREEAGRKQFVIREARVPTRKAAARIPAVRNIFFREKEQKGAEIFPESGWWKAVLNVENIFCVREEE